MSVRALWRAFALPLWTMLLVPIQALAVATSRPLARRVPCYYHRVACRLLGVRVASQGRPSAVRPTLFVCNHASYLDIAVLGSLLSASFVAKQEIASWPFFGTLARLQRSVFVERRAARSREHRDVVHQRLELGDNLVLFPEGTSNDGKSVLRFNSTLFATAERPVCGAPLCVQPVSLAYTRLHGLPLGLRHRAIYAWYGDMSLLDHMWEVLRRGPVTASIVFHPPVTIEAFKSRKDMSAFCHDRVADGVSALISGRALSPALPGAATAAVSA